MSRNGQRVVHQAKLMDDKGRVSPLCAKAPRALDMKRSSWVWAPKNRSAATCPRCMAALAAQQAQGAPEAK